MQYIKYCHDYYIKYILHLNIYEIFFTIQIENGDGSLKPRVHTKNDNYEDKDISVHNSELYRQFILSACSSAALNYRARYSRIDSDWVSMFV